MAIDFNLGPQREVIYHIFSLPHTRTSPAKCGLFVSREIPEDGPIFLLGPGDLGLLSCGQCRHNCTLARRLKNATTFCWPSLLGHCTVSMGKLIFEIVSIISLWTRVSSTTKQFLSACVSLLFGVSFHFVPFRYVTLWCWPFLDAS